MSEQTWNETGNLKPDLSPPEKIVRDISEGLKDFTDGLVDFEIEKVNFFPDEVTHSTQFNNPFLSQLSNKPQTVKDPHPEFGYNPSEGTNVTFRFRYILKVVNKPSVKAEIFKFKYPVDFYPVIFFIGKHDFNTLKKYINEGENLQVEKEDKFKKVCLAIFRSDEFARIVRRLSAIGT